jgi:Tfp pilus assembly protein FimT
MAVVLVILGLLFGVSALRFDHLTQNSRLRASAREVGSTVGLAYSEALVRRERQSLVFDTENGAYWIETGDEGAESEYGRKRTLYRGVRFRNVQTGAEVFEEEGEVRIEISPLGVSTSCFIHLTNEEEKEMTVRVHPLTGTVTYLDGYVAYEDTEEGAVD